MCEKESTLTSTVYYILYHCFFCPQPKFHVIKLFCLYVKILHTSRDSATEATDREDLVESFPSPGVVVLGSVVLGSFSNSLLHSLPVQQRFVMVSLCWYVQLELHPTSNVSVPFV